MDHMTSMMLLFSVLWMLLAVAAYRLGMADGLSAARRGRLAGSRDKKTEDLLNKIEAYDGRKEPYGKRK